MPTHARTRPSSPGRFPSRPAPRRSAPKRTPRTHPTQRFARSKPSSGAGHKLPRFGRAQPKQSPVQKMIGKVGGLFGGGKASKKAAPSAKQGAGLALLAGAAGLAMKNRDKIARMVGRGDKHEQVDTTPAVPTTPAPSHPLDNRP